MSKRALCQVWVGWGEWERGRGFSVDGCPGVDTSHGGLSGLHGAGVQVRNGDSFYSDDLFSQGGWALVRRIRNSRHRKL